MMLLEEDVVDPNVVNVENAETTKETETVEDIQKA